MVDISPANISITSMVQGTMEEYRTSYLGRKIAKTYHTLSKITKISTGAAFGFCVGKAFSYPLELLLGWDHISSFYSLVIGGLGGIIAHNSLDHPWPEHDRTLTRKRILLYQKKRDSLLRRIQ